jgi:hypothetical protein
MPPAPARPSPCWVGVRLTARLSRTSMALGCTAAISGQVVPAHRSQRIRLQRRQGRAWRTVQTKTLPATGRYSFGLRPRASGTSGWRIYMASDADHIGAISRTLRLVVYRAAITGIHADAAGDGMPGIGVSGSRWRLSAQKGATVRIHTGRGTTRAGHLYLASGRPVWNNDGDTGTIIDPHNAAVSRYRY